MSWPGLKGQLSTQNRPASFGASIDGTYEMGDGTIVDMSNRNIHYGNNVMVWSQELVDFMNYLADNPWGWDINADPYDPDASTMVYDTMFYADAQLIVHGDTTLHLISRNVGVTSSDNEILPIMM